MHACYRARTEAVRQSSRMHITSEQPPQISESDSIPEHMASQHVNPSLKVWQAWPGRHIFCCDGRVMVGPDIGITIFAAALTTGTCITFWVFVCTTFPVPAFLSGALLFCTTMFFLAMTATTDPGIIPSNRGMDQAQIAACAQAQRTVDVNGVSIPLKWCRTCHIFRPPRAAHCSECNVCVERFDHHWCECFPLILQHVCVLIRSACTTLLIPHHMVCVCLQSVDGTVYWQTQLSLLPRLR